MTVTVVCLYVVEKLKPGKEIDSLVVGIMSAEEQCFMRIGEIPINDIIKIKCNWTKS